MPSFSSFWRPRKHRLPKSHGSTSLRFEQLEQRHLLAVLTIAQENALPGTPQSVWDVKGSGSGNIQGFATQISVDHGETEYFKVRTNTIQYHIDIYRLGYYGGDGARYITTIHPDATKAQKQPRPLTDPSTGLVDAGNWAVSAHWDVPVDATSGVYLAKLVRDDGTFGQSHMVFVVRNDEAHSDILFKTDDSTWEAYNTWGGASLYTGNGPGTGGRAYEVSYNRPYTTRTDQPESWVLSNEFPMIQWLEQNGYDVSYTTDLDVATDGASLLDHRVLMSTGHDEYWSAAERANMTAARDAGVNLAFFSGNEGFWKTSWGPSIDSASDPNRTLICYKETLNEQPLNPTPGLWTGTWRDPTFSPPRDGGQPENALTGTMFIMNDNGTPGSSIVVSSQYANLRFWRNTAVASLKPGQSLSLGQYTLGYEWDTDPDNGFRPGGLFDLATTTVTNTTSSLLIDYGATYAPGTATWAMTLYRAASGALVFSTGTVHWSWGLSGKHDIATTTPDATMQQATVNLFADMGVQPATLQPGLIRATASGDRTPPTSTITYPTNGLTLTPGVPITITGTAQDAGGVLTAVEVSVDGGLTWHRASGTANWSYRWTPSTSGSDTILSRAVDDSANIEAPGPGVTINPASAGTSVYSLWNNATVPGSVDGGDPKAVTLGMKFATNADGFINGVRFYKSAANTGVHVASLWTAAGTLLATATFTSESASGWQQVNFSSPVAIKANTTYVVSYYAPNGHYSVTNNFFSNSQVNSGPLHSIPATQFLFNGVYVYGANAFPTNSFQSSNYWLDVIFAPSAPQASSPAVTWTNPQNNATQVATSAAVTIAFNEALDPATINSSTVRLMADGIQVPAALAYDPTAHAITLTPNVPLANATDYTIVVAGGAAGVKDPAGRAMASTFSSSFTTISAGPFSIWTASTTPGSVDSGDPKAVELGMKFQSNVAGYITGVRFYKSSGNTGTHVANLWSSTGTLLASAVFTAETATGWQQVNFAAPVAISANTTYVVSYHTATGHYSVDRNYFASAVTSGPLTALASGTAGNGVYLYGAGGFPINTFQASNYYVDVVFSTSAIAPLAATTSASSRPAIATAALAVATSQPSKLKTASASSFAPVARAAPAAEAKTHS